MYRKFLSKRLTVPSWKIRFGIAQWNDIKLAMQAKTTVNEDEAKQILATTYYVQNLGSDITHSPTAGVIWDLKDKPSWD
jgi:hypothetical protein